LRIACYISSRACNDRSAAAKRLKKCRGLPSCGMSNPPLVKRSVRISGHPTSISLEAPFWDALREIAERRQLSVNALLAAIDAERSGNLSSAIRLFVLESCRRGELPGR
jgi:predicted DNA-binding ribbon-helix-helix protein